MTKHNILNKIKKGTEVLAVTALMAAMAAQPVMAASTISSVSIKLNIDLQDGDDLPTLDIGHTDSASADSLEVMIPDNNKYEIASAEWSKEVDEVKLGNTYKLKVVLEPLDEDDYAFKSSYAASKVTVKGGSFVSARRNDADQLVVTLKTKEAEGILAEPDEPRWLSENFKNDKFGYAKWDSVTDAAYQIHLYRNDKIIHRVSDWMSTSYNFYPYMTKEGDYHFRVRAIPKNEDVKKYATSSEWTESEEMYVDDNEVSDGTGQGQQANTPDPAVNNAASGIIQVGWIKNDGKWYFRYPDGTYLRDSWGKIDGKWYLFNNTGEMLTGWQSVNNVWYYLNSSGDMFTGWLWDNNTWYYLNPDGSMKTGWLIDNGKTYYLNPGGAMLTGWQEIGGLYYYFYADGHKAVNETISGFYVDYNGVWQRP
ncbi:MAG: N-acetylmuramoyl-L-alanine amidase family protein [Lachnospiraceae bacterium]|nr:N-acetylmuramoyl-L-alanine amidase family protein [Lachnospiraceae bacterium]